MPDLQDTLETVLRLVGASQYIAGLNQIAAAHQRVAAAALMQQQAQAAVGRALAGGQTVGMATLGMAGQGGAAAVGAARIGLGGSAMLAGLAAAGFALRAVTEEMVTYETELQRIQAFQRNMGRTVPTRQFQEFARNLSASQGIQQTEILKTIDMLERYGPTVHDVGRDAQQLARSSQATGMSMSGLAEAIEAARHGRAQELFRELGIPIKGVNNQLYEFDTLLKMVDERTRNMRLQGLPLALNQTSAALEALKISFGKLIEPAEIQWLKGLTAMFQMFAGDFQALSEGRWGDFFSGKAALDAMHPKVGQLGGGGTGESASERYLRKIEMNTGAMGPLGRATRGGGSFGEPGAGLRIRDYNTFIRKVL